MAGGILEYSKALLVKLFLLRLKGDVEEMLRGFCGPLKALMVVGFL